MSEAQKTSELPEALRVARAWTVEQRPEDIAAVFLVSRALLDLYEQLEAAQQLLADTYGSLAHQMNAELLARYDEVFSLRERLKAVGLIVSNPASGAGTSSAEGANEANAAGPRVPSPASEPEAS